MWAGFDEASTDEALSFHARNPAPPKPQEASFLQQAGELAASPFKGIAQAVNESLRIVNRVGGAQAQEDPAERRAMRGGPVNLLFPEAHASIEEHRATATAKRAEATLGADEFLRDAVDFWKPDPLAATTASRVLQDGSRLLSKVGVYAATGGPVGVVIGTGLDEASTGYLELRDKGVDPTTAGQAAAVRGVSTAVGVALPIAGKTGLQTLGLVAAGGPGSFMAEQALTREILESANYPELAAQHDPFDLVGLGVSLLLTGTVGAVAHGARAKAGVGAAAAPSAPSSAPRPAQLVADLPEVRDAAHVAYQTHVTEQHMLGDRSDPQARAAHVTAVEDAARAMEAGEPVRITALAVDSGRAIRVAEELMQRLRGADAELAAVRSAQTPIPEAPMPAAPLQAQPARPADGAMVERIERQLQDQPAPVAPPMQRAEDIVRQHPDLPVRMDEGDTPVTARDLMDQVRRDINSDRTDARAFDAAITCFLRSGA